MKKVQSRHRLPPLNSLRAFEAAGRHLSFKTAAEELNVTPGAISQQIRRLEEQIGAALFQRHTRAIRLTTTGRAALPLLRDAFDRLAEVNEILHVRGAAPYLTVSVAPSFAAKWLVPRLERFRQTHPDFDIRIDATDGLARFAGQGIDAAIRYGRGNYGELLSECLLRIDAFPVCSPLLLERGPPLNTPADIRHYTLLHTHWAVDDDAAPSWQMWLTAAGVTDIDWDRGPQFSNESMTVEAAAEGQGLALTSFALIEQELASGRLIRPFPASAAETTEFSYYLVYPPYKQNDPKVVAFHNWLLEEIGPDARCVDDAAANVA